MLLPSNPAASAAVEPAANTANPCINVRRDIFPFSYASNSLEIVSFIEFLLFYSPPRRGGGSKLAGRDAKTNMADFRDRRQLTNSLPQWLSEEGKTRHTPRAHAWTILFRIA